MTDTEDRAEATAPRAGLSGGILTALFVGVVAMGAAVAFLRGAPATAEVGRPAPQFSVESFGGEQFDLAQQTANGRGPVLLNLWASWCEPCRREFPTLSQWAAAHPEVTVVGVAVQDTEKEAQSFAGRMNPSYLVSWDADGSVHDAYPSFGIPASYVIDAKGVLVDVILAELTPERLAGIDFSG